MKHNNTMTMTIGEIFRARKIEKSENRAIAAIGIALFVGAVWFLAQGVKMYMNLPLVQFDTQGRCLRVLDAEGSKVENGCKTVLTNKNLLYKSEVVGRKK